MGLDFLARVRNASLWVMVVAALFLAVYTSYVAGAGFAAGALWSLANLWLLEKLVVTLTGPARSAPGALGRAGLGLAANAALFAIGALMLLRLPVLPLVAGFTVPFAVMVLKAGSRALLESAAWERFTRSRWRAAIVVLLVVGAAWFASSLLTRASAAEHAGRGAKAAAVEPAAAEPAASGHAASSEAGAAKEAGPREFDTILSWIVRANEGKPWAQFVEHYEVVLFSAFIALVLCVIAMLASRNAQMIPGPLQNGVEAVVEQVYDRIVDILGPKYGPRYVPFLGSLFLYVFAMNLFGIVPLMKSPTSSLNVTLALALTVFVYVQFTAFRELGPLGWLDHMAGNPRSAIEWGLVVIILPIHLIGELAKPVSLSCRLFGNIFGEDMLLVGFATLGIGLMAALHLSSLPFGVPLQFIFLFLALLTSFVQALVFSMLSTIYFLLMLPHDDAHGHGEEAHHPAH